MSKYVAETRISLSNKLLLLVSSIKSCKCDVSFLISGRFDVKSGQMLSINLDKFSIAVLHPVVNKFYMSFIKSITLTWLCFIITNILLPFFLNFFFPKPFFTLLFKYLYMFFCWIIIKFLK